MMKTTIECKDYLVTMKENGKVTIQTNRTGLSHRWLQREVEELKWEFLYKKVTSCPITIKARTYQAQHDHALVIQKLIQKTD